MTFIYDVQVNHVHIEARDQKGELHAMVSVWGDDFHEEETRAQILFIEQLCAKWGLLLHSKPARVREPLLLGEHEHPMKNIFMIARSELPSGQCEVSIEAIDQLGREHVVVLARATRRPHMMESEKLARVIFIEELSQQWGIHAAVKQLSVKMWMRLDAGAKPYDKSGKYPLHELSAHLRPKADESGYVLLDSTEHKEIIAEFSEDDVVWR